MNNSARKSRLAKTSMVIH